MLPVYTRLNEASFTFTTKSSVSHNILLPFLAIVRLYVSNVLLASDIHIVSQTVGVAGNVKVQAHQEVLASIHSLLDSVYVVVLAIRFNHPSQSAHWSH